MKTIVQLLPVGYFVTLLVEQARMDWPALSEPRFDLDTVLALSAAGYILLLLASYWRKPPALAERRDLFAVITTVVAIDAFGFIARQPISQVEAYFPATLLILIGTAIAYWSALSLGSAFSILPQARSLVVHGPYTYLRHPMYAGGLLITLGELWLRWAPIAVLMCVVMVTAQLVRLRLEEQLLTEQLPGYAIYRAKTSALIPGVY